MRKNNNKKRAGPSEDRSGDPEGFSRPLSPSTLRQLTNTFAAVCKLLRKAKIPRQGYYFEFAQNI